MPTPGGPVGGNVALRVPPQLESDSIDPDTARIRIAPANHPGRRRRGSKSRRTPPESAMPVVPRTLSAAFLLFAAGAAVVDRTSCVLTSEPCTANGFVLNPQVGFDLLQRA